MFAKSTTPHQSACDVREINRKRNERPSGRADAPSVRMKRQPKHDMHDSGSMTQIYCLECWSIVTFNGAAAGTVASLLYLLLDISNRNPSGSFRGLLPCMGDESVLCS